MAQPPTTRRNPHHRRKIVGRSSPFVYPKIRQQYGEGRRTSPVKARHKNERRRHRCVRSPIRRVSTDGWLSSRRTTDYRHFHGRITPQSILKDLRTRSTQNLSAVEGSGGKKTTAICPCTSPNGCPQKQQPKTTNWRVGSERTTISSRCHGYIRWKNQGKACRIRGHQLPHAPIHTPRRIYIARKRRGTSASRYKGSGMLHMPQKGTLQSQLFAARLESTQESGTRSYRRRQKRSRQKFTPSRKPTNSSPTLAAKGSRRRRRCKRPSTTRLTRTGGFSKCLNLAAWVRAIHQRN